MNPALELLAQAQAAIALLEEWHAMLIRSWAKGAKGWAPAAAQTILVRSRLDRQESLCKCLNMWIHPTPPVSDGFLILAWANLGAVVEGSLKVFLSVWAHAYAKDPIKRRGVPQDPDELMFEGLRQFFREHVWSGPGGSLSDESEWDRWLEVVQQRRNTIHAYRERDLGSHDEFLATVVKYVEFARMLDGRIPYYDGS